MKKLRHILAALAALALTLPVQANTVYRPGLMQVLFKQGSANGFASAVSGVPVLASNILEKASSDSFADGPERVLYPLMDRDSNVVNSLTGTKWTWPDQYGTFAYEGEMYVEEGTTYTFYGRFDDGSAIVIDGTTVLMQQQDSGYNKQPQVWGDWTATTTGWVPLNAWIWDWTGGKAVKDCYYALQYNTAGVKNDFGNSSKWSRFNETGNMSLLRVRLNETYTTVASFAEEGDDLQISLSFSNLPSDANITFCYGDSDAGLSVEAWENRFAAGSVTAGETSKDFTVHGAKGATVLRVYVEGAESTPEDAFVEWSTPVALAANPLVALESVTPSYTNASFAVNLNGLGVGASSASLRIEVAATEDGFGTPLFSIPFADNPVSDIGMFTIEGAGFETNTTYFARAVATNDGNADGFSGVLSFTTMNPQFAEGAGSFAGRGFTELSAMGIVTDFGTGSACAVIRLEADADGDFLTLDGVSDEVDAAVGAGIVLSLQGLSANTAYHLRFRVVNEWGLVTYLPITGTCSTRDVPLSATGIGYEFSADGSTVDISFGVVEVFDGATCTATLTYGGKVIGTKTFGSSGLLVWEGVDAAGAAAEAVVTVESTVGGTTYSKSWSTTSTPGTSAHALSALTDLADVVFHVGDSAVLPELIGVTDYYLITDCRTFALGADGVTLTALEPGFGGVVAMEYDVATGNFVRNATMGFGVVAPEPNGTGRVWLCTKSGSNGYDWTTVGWKNLTDDAEGWPNGVDDVAMVALPGNSTIYVNASVTLGALYLGFDTETVLPGRATNNSNGDQSIYIAAKNASTLSFAASGKNRSLLRFCNFGNRNIYETTPHIRLGFWNATAANQLTIVQNGDMDWDCGAVQNYTDTAKRDVFDRVRMGTECGAGWTVPKGATLRIFNVTGYKNWGDDQCGNAQFWLRSSFPFSGAGEIVYDGPGSTYVSNPFRKFEGTITVRNKQRYSQFSMGSRGGSFYMINWDSPVDQFATNATLKIEGDVGYDNGLSLGRSYGVVATGSAHGYGSAGWMANVVPARKWILNGGAYYDANMNNNAVSWRADGTAATEPVREPNGAETLCVSNGFSYIYLGQNDNADRPTNNLAFASLEHAGDGVLVASNDRMWNSYRKSGWRVRLALGGFHDHAIGGTGAADAIHGSDDVRANILDSNAPIVPWIVASVESALTLYFPGASPDGELVMAGHPESVVLDEVTDPTMNVNVKAQTSLTLTEDRTVNSLRIPNPNGGSATFNLGEGRTITITSGGLIVGNGSHSRGGIGNESGYNAGTAGTIVFPNKAYIFTPSQNGADGKHAAIWAKIVSPKGAVFSYPGYLDLGGDQTGIDDHIAVNGTCLKLGSATTGCEIDVPMHLYGANSAIVINKEGSFCKQELYFWDHGTLGSKFVPAAGTTEKVFKLYIDGVNMPRGTYGATGSGAQYIDDNHFSGTGIACVMKDDLTHPLILIVR